MTPFEAPQAGHRFHENHTFHVEILKVEAGAIAIRETPATFGQSHGYRFFRNAEAFRKAYSYPDGRAWIEYVDNRGTTWNGSMLALMFEASGRDGMSPEEVERLLE